MSLEIWPPLSADQLKVEIQHTQDREVAWLLQQLHDVLKTLKQGLEDCYALLAPVEPGTTLPVTTHRNELVKGHVTRVGTKIVKGTLYLQLRTLPPLTLDIDITNPIRLAPLDHLHALLTHSIDLLTLTVSHAFPADHIPPITQSLAGLQAVIPQSDSPAALSTFLAAQLRLLAQSLTEASALLKGLTSPSSSSSSSSTTTAATTSARPSSPRSAPPLTPLSDPNWTTRACAPIHFRNRANRELHLPDNLSLYWGIQDSSLVLWIRHLEDARQPLHFGMKFALAIGTARRLEHDEADKEFGYTYPEGSGHGDAVGGDDKAKTQSLDGAKRKEGRVLVREKIRVESADPSLLSLSAKLLALGHTLELARQNLAAVMDEEMED